MFLGPNDSDMPIVMERYHVADLLNVNVSVLNLNTKIVFVSVITSAVSGESLSYVRVRSFEEAL